MQYKIWKILNNKEVELGTYNKEEALEIVLDLDTNGIGFKMIEQRR